MGADLVVGHITFGIPKPGGAQAIKICMSIVVVAKGAMNPIVHVDALQDVTGRMIGIGGRIVIKISHRGIGMTKVTGHRYLNVRMAKIRYVGKTRVSILWWDGSCGSGLLFVRIQQKSERITGVAPDWTDFKAAIGRIQFPLSM